MIITFILNGEDVDIRVRAELRLVDILRDHFKLTGTKSGCSTGMCGACSVILNGELVKSCLVPAFKIKDSEIITIEGFSQTDEFQDIVRAFAEAEVQNCGFCNSGKIMAVEALLNRNRRPSQEEILGGFSGVRCRCTEPKALVQAVTAAVEYRRQRFYGRSS